MFFRRQNDFLSQRTQVVSTAEPDIEEKKLFHFELENLRLFSK